MDFLPVAGPSITQKEIDYVTDAVTHAWFDQAYSYCRRFETAFAAYCGRRYAVSLPSCTSALHLALAALDIGPGDEVIVPDATWIASAAPITYVGATPVFADIAPDSWCLSTPSVAHCVTSRTRAIIAVDLYGSLPDMRSLSALARRHGIALIEDAAQAISSTYRGRRAGGFGDVSAFSFHGSKTLTTGEGGMLLTDRDDIYKRVSVLRDHGRQPGDTQFWNTEVGFKYKMTDMQAALGLAQLERIEELAARKREIFAWYRQELDGLPCVRLNPDTPHVDNSYYMVTLLLAPEMRLTRDALMAALKERNIGTRPFFHPLSFLPAYNCRPQASEAARRNLCAYAIAPQGINLPSGFNMDQERVRYVCDQIKRCSPSKRRPLFVAHTPAIPILMYHKVGVPIRCKADRFLNVLPDQFALHLRLLARLGYEAVTFAQAVEGLRAGVGLPRRPVCLTFDDAHLCIADYAAPLLAQRGWKATVFVPTACVGDVNAWDRALGKPLAPIMNWKRLRQLQASGWEVGAHTRTHPHLEQLDEERAYAEIAGSKAELEQRMEQAIVTFCYPFGRYNAMTPRLVEAAGFIGACTTHKQWATASHDPLLLPRIGVSRGDVAGFMYRLFARPRFSGETPVRCPAHS